MLRFSRSLILQYLEDIKTQHVRIQQLPCYTLDPSLFSLLLKVWRFLASLPFIVGSLLISKILPVTTIKIRNDKADTSNEMENEDEHVVRPPRLKNQC